MPLWIEQLKHEPLSDLLARAPELSQVIAEKGDLILFRGSKRGETARAFNALAEAVAICAFMPGGVTIFDTHFEASHPDQAREVAP